MLGDYSIDMAVERITHPITKEYFREVQSSYAIGNYRSAIIALYSVVISDLVFKLKDQYEREEDKGAQRILDEIQTEKSKDVASSKWEGKLVEMVFKETKILELSDKANIENLKNHRNLAAHPNILDNEDNVLYTPNKDTVRAHIRNMLDGVLSKYHTHTDQLVLDIVTKRIPEIAQRVDSKEEFERIIQKRYFGALNERALKKLFKMVWKFTYRLDNEDGDKGREMNGLITRYISRVYPDIVFTSINDDPNYFNYVSLKLDQLTEMMYLFNESPRMFLLLEEDLRNQVKSALREFQDLFVSSKFLYSNADEHFEEVREYLHNESNISTDTFMKFYELAEQLNKKDDYIHLLMKFLRESSSHSEGKKRMLLALEKLPSFNENHFHQLLRVMDANIWINKDNSISFNMYSIILKAQELGFAIDLRPYENLPQKIYSV